MFYSVTKWQRFRCYKRNVIVLLCHIVFILCKFLVVTIDDREFPKEEFYNLGKGIKEMVQKTFPNIEIIVIPKFVELIPFEEKEKFKEYINSKL